MLVNVGLWLACTMSGEEPHTGEETPAASAWRVDPQAVVWPWETSSRTVFACPDGTGDVRTLAEGLAALPDGGLLLLCGRRFTEPLVVERTVRVVGTPGTVIDALGSGSAVTVRTGAALSLSGLVVTGGTGNLGGGIACEDASVTLEDVVVAGNHAAAGGGVAMTRCRFDVRGSRFEQNVAESAGDGGGFLARASTGTVEDSSFVANLAHRGGGWSWELSAFHADDDARRRAVAAGVASARAQQRDGVHGANALARDVERRARRVNAQLQGRRQLRRREAIKVAASRHATANASTSSAAPTTARTGR
jgi:hypothetical protein